MLVKAKWNVKDAAGWHYTGEVFHTEDDLGAAVEVLDAPKPVAVKAEPENAPEGAPEAKQKASRRKKPAE